jgi:C-terminal processing protease CtpA/Prc
VFELHDGSGIVVTVGKYVTPDHKDINGDGIEPDYRRLPGAVHIHRISFFVTHRATWLTALLN